MKIAAVWTRRVVIAVFIFAGGPAFGQSADADVVIGRIIDRLGVEIAEIGATPCGSAWPEPPVVAPALDASRPPDLQIAVQFEDAAYDLAVYVRSLRPALRELQASALALEARLGAEAFAISLGAAMTEQDIETLAAHPRAAEVDALLAARRVAVEALLDRCEEAVARLRLNETIALDVHATYRAFAAYHRAIPPGFQGYALGSELMLQLPSQSAVQIEALQARASDTLRQLNDRLRALKAEAQAEARRLAPIRALDTALQLAEFGLKSYQFVSERFGNQTEAAPDVTAPSSQTPPRLEAQRPESGAPQSGDHSDAGGPLRSPAGARSGELMLDTLWRRIESAAPHPADIAGLSDRDRANYISDVHAAIRLLNGMSDTSADRRVAEGQISPSDFTPDLSCSGPICAVEYVLGALLTPTVVGDGTPFGAAHRQLRREQLQPHLDGIRLWNDLHEGRDPLRPVLRPFAESIEWPTPGPTMRSR